MRRSEQMIDICESSLAERTQCFALDHKHILAHDLLDLHAANIELAIRCFIRTEGEQWCVPVERDDIGRGVHGKLR